MKRMCKFLILSVICFSVFAGTQEKEKANAEHARKILEDALLLTQFEMRDSISGQYYDALPLEGKDKDLNSSVAATGMGLIALAMADELELLENADVMTLMTLKNILGKNPSFFSKRSKEGWFRHWFHGPTGEDNGGSRGDGYSTIDSAILVAGAGIASKHFRESDSPLQKEINKLYKELLFSIEWPSAVSHFDKGLLYLNYDLETGLPKASTAKFNEYIIVACLGLKAEREVGKTGKMTRFWNQHYNNTQGLPKIKYQSHELLTDHSSNFLSSFAIQFGMYLCPKMATNIRYQHFFKEAQKADKLWFKNQGVKESFWGLGAGEVRYLNDITGDVEASYHADKINNNPHLIVSPHIVAGFLPVYPKGLEDLIKLKENKDCLYQYNGYEFLWRCQAKNPTFKINRLQAIDFSSMYLGLGFIHPQLGSSFFKF